MQGPRFTFGDFEFDAGSGELRGADGEVQRLPPQPASLLTLLLERRGELVTREEIRQRLWPGVRIDFDRSLHFCVRQIRSALGDSANDARYVENLPRRGYRMIPAVEVVAPSVRAASARWPALAAVIAALGVALAIFLSLNARTPEMRIAIMPFVPPAGSSSFESASPIAEWILRDLTQKIGKQAGIVGPTSTSGFEDSGASLRELADELDLQFIVNGRFIDDEKGARMLAELIRVSDGAHIWVRAYDDLGSGREIGEEIAREVRRELGFD